MLHLNCFLSTCTLPLLQSGTIQTDFYPHTVVVWHYRLPSTCTLPLLQSGTIQTAFFLLVPSHCCSLALQTAFYLFPPTVVVWHYIDCPLFTCTLPLLQSGTIQTAFYLLVPSHCCSLALQTAIYLYPPTVVVWHYIDCLLFTCTLPLFQSGTIQTAFFLLVPSHCCSLALYRLPSFYLYRPTVVVWHSYRLPSIYLYPSIVVLLHQLNYLSACTLPLLQSGTISS